MLRVASRDGCVAVRVEQDMKAAQAAAAAGKGRAGKAPAQTPGEAMRAAGAALVGRRVLRFWPDSGGWWEADVRAYDAASQRHRLVYDAGLLQAQPASDQVDPAKVSLGTPRESCTLSRYLFL